LIKTPSKPADLLCGFFGFLMKNQSTKAIAVRRNGQTQYGSMKDVQWLPHAERLG